MKRIRSRQRIVARAAFVTALAACASAAGAWLMELAPLAARLAG